jgi:hypothetical protein
MCMVEGVPARLPPRPRVIFLGGDEIEYTERVPELWLAPWVQAFWHLKCVKATTLRVPPDGCMDIINGHVVGSLTSVIVAELKPGDESFGVRLRPGAFTALYGVPADELTDTDVALDDLVRKAPSLLAVAADADPPDPIAEAAMHEPNVKTLSRDSGTASATCDGVCWRPPGMAHASWRGSPACRRCSPPGEVRAGRARRPSSATTTSRT